MFLEEAHFVMRCKKVVCGTLLGGTLLCVPMALHGADLKIKIPKRTKPTPVQKLNQDGVHYIEKHDYSRARKAFYRAYLLDPDDPFTLNNLGYVAELDGEIEKAQKFYELAAENASDATVARATDPEMKGKSLAQVAGNAVDAQMRVNRMNVYAMGLLMKDRAPEAEVTLRKALDIDQNNPFTLNNLGYALEKEGELEQAVQFYRKAASLKSDEKVVVALNKDWRGRRITEIADRNADAAQRQLRDETSVEARVARLNLRGVSAINRNQPRQARQFFEEAYKLDPNNAFAMNNMGYLAEADGDRETANFFYDKARAANGAGARVTVATRRDAQGQRLAQIASTNNQVVSDAQEKQLAMLRSEGPVDVRLRTRNNSFVSEPATPPTPDPGTPIRVVEDNPPPEPEPRPAMASPSPRNPAPEASSPAASGNAGTGTPAPTNAAPSNTQQPSSAPVSNPGNVTQPLPQSQQPPVPTVQPPKDEPPLLPVIPDDPQGM